MNFMWLDLEQYEPHIKVPVIPRIADPKSFEFLMEEEDEYETYLMRGYIINGGDKLAVFGTPEMSTVDCEKQLIENFSNPEYVKEA